MALFKELAQKNKGLKKKLLMAKLDEEPEAYVKKAVKSSLMFSVIITFAALMFIVGVSMPLWYVAIVFLVAEYLTYSMFMHRVDVYIRKRQKEIDRDVLFAGRFLLVKLNSGRPLINSLIDASKSYGVANKYFHEIVTDIELGTPVEEALDKASRYSPSENFRRILFQLSTALKIGVDVSQFLDATLEEIAESQLINIKRYGKKLSGLTMFYMLFAIVIPSLGITLFITVAGLVNLRVDMALFSIFLFMLVIVEFIFISIFKSSRPNINI